MILSRLASTLGPSLIWMGVLVASPTAAWAQAGPPAMRGAPPPPPPSPGGPPVMRGAPPQPPPPPVEHVEPRRGFVWVEGNYEWRDGRYAWSGGHWEPERPGRQWHGGHWDRRGERYVWVRGEWVQGPVYAPPPRQVVVAPPAPPPPPQVIVESPPPPRGYVWIPGANEWRDGRYVWVEGRWEKERHGHRWQSGHWDRDGDRHAWHAGGWHRDDDGDDQGPGPRGPISIMGRITGPNGAPVPGIPVVLAGTSEGRAVTDGCSPDVVNLNNLGGPATQNFSTSCGRR